MLRGSCKYCQDIYIYIYQYDKEAQQKSAATPNLTEYHMFTLSHSCLSILAMLSRRAKT
jgi:hypothetical protein